MPEKPGVYEAITIKKDLPDVMMAPTVPAVAAPSVQSTVVSQSTDTEVKQEVPQGKAITSPMVGTFYSAPSPEDAPFVEIGSEVKAGDVVCIIEAMKLMNEIKSEQEGKVVKICVKNGDPVEFGQVLMYVE